MSGFYDASAPPPDQGPEVDEQLAAARMAAVESDLERALDRVGDLVARFEEQLDEEGVDDDTVALLEEITGDPDAPLEFRSLHRRVHEGYLTWTDFWRRPQDEAGGVALLREVTVRHLRLVATAQQELARREADEHR